jgi:predicted nuclease of predicted toxin-antitoxin system
MRFLVDQCLSADLAVALSAARHDVLHVRELGMQRAADQEVLDAARRDDRVLISADTDFGTILAQTAAAGPSLVVFRRTTSRRPAQQAALLLANLDEIAEALDEGSVVVIEETRIRVRRLPIVE